jgi:predicted ATPase
MTVLAQALVRTGAIDQAFEVLGQALEQIEREGERHYEAETYRLKGDFLIAQKNDPDGAERNYLRAVAVARDQQAKLFELRASTSLARFWHCNDKTEEACNLLNPVY